jgi:hypothetical protein
MMRTAIFLAVATATTCWPRLERTRKKKARSGPGAALFAGHDRGAEHWGIVASLIETAKLNGVDPQACLASVLSGLVNGWPMRKIDELMPCAYATSQNATAVAENAANRNSASCQCETGLRVRVPRRTQHTTFHTAPPAAVHYRITRACL